MTTIRIADTESNGFVDVATKLWCISSIDYEDEDNEARLFGPDDIQSGLHWLNDCDVLVGHNFIKHDLPLLKKLFDWEPKSNQIIVDTLVFSRMLNPKRPLPEGYYGGKTHSIEAWGYRVGHGKPDHEDWSKYTKAMGKRCMDDALINRLVLKELENEADALKEMYYHKPKKS